MDKLTADLEKMRENYEQEKAAAAAAGSKALRVSEEVERTKKVRTTCPSSFVRCPF